MGALLRKPGGDGLRDGADVRYWKFLAEMQFGKLSGRDDTLGGIR